MNKIVTIFLIFLLLLQFFPQQPTYGYYDASCPITVNDTIAKQDAPVSVDSVTKTLKISIGNQLTQDKYEVNVGGYKFIEQINTPSFNRTLTKPLPKYETIKVPGGRAGKGGSKRQEVYQPLNSAFTPGPHLIQLKKHTGTWLWWDRYDDLVCGLNIAYNINNDTKISSCSIIFPEPRYYKPGAPIHISGEIGGQHFNQFQSKLLLKAATLGYKTTAATACISGSRRETSLTFDIPDFKVEQGIDSYLYLSIYSNKSNDRADNCINPSDKPLCTSKSFQVTELTPKPTLNDSDTIPTNGSVDNDPPTAPPPPPPCTDIDHDTLACNKVSTAIGNISTSPEGFIGSIFSLILSISGGIALLLIIFSGYTMMTSQGNPERVQGARETLTSAIVGLLFIIFSFAILQVITVDIFHIPGFSK